MEKNLTRDKRNLKFETLQLHVGQEQADPATDARAVPIYQTTSYVFHDCRDAEDRFSLKAEGNIYGRLTNPTQAVFEQRMAALEGGSAALAVASGAAAICYTFQGLAGQGDHIVAAKNIYGGTYNLLAHTLPEYGITTTFVDPFQTGAFEDAIQENTKAVFSSQRIPIVPTVMVMAFSIFQSWQTVSLAMALWLIWCASLVCRTSRTYHIMYIANSCIWLLAFPVM